MTPRHNSPNTSTTCEFKIQLVRSVWPLFQPKFFVVCRLSHSAYHDVCAFMCLTPLAINRSVACLAHDRAATTHTCVW